MQKKEEENFYDVLYVLHRKTLVGAYHGQRFGYGHKIIMTMFYLLSYKTTHLFSFGFNLLVSWMK